MEKEAGDRAMVALTVPAKAATAVQPEKKKERPSALRSIIAGSTAGAVEIGTFFLF